MSVKEAPGEKLQSLFFKVTIQFIDREDQDCLLSGDDKTIKNLVKSFDPRSTSEVFAFVKSRVLGFHAIQVASLDP